MTGCEHQVSECDCQKCDSFTCFEKRKKPGSCDCPVCKNSRTCVFYPHEIKATKDEQNCDVANKGCNTVDVWQKSDKYHLGRDVVCSGCEANKKRSKPKDVCTHRKVQETCEGDSLKSNDKLCSQCEFKRNVIGCMQEESGNTGPEASLESSKDQVLCQKCELKKTSNESKDNADLNGGHICQLLGSKNGTTDTPSKSDSDSDKNKGCPKCEMKGQSAQKFKKYSFDEGKIYEFPDDNKNKGCPKCEMNEQSAKFRKFSFEEGKIYEFPDDNKQIMCPKCQQKKGRAQKFKKYSFEDGKIYEFIDEDKSKGCPKCQMMEEILQSFRKYSFDNGKNYEIPGQKKMCSKCQLKKNALDKFRKFSFDNGKVYEFDANKNSNDELRNASEAKEQNLCNLHAGKEAEPPELCVFHAGNDAKPKKICPADCAKDKPEHLCLLHARKDYEPKKDPESQHLCDIHASKHAESKKVCPADCDKDPEPNKLCDFHAKAAEPKKVCAFDCSYDLEPKKVCSLHAGKDDKPKNLCSIHAGKPKNKETNKICTRCGRNKIAEPISMKIVYKDKCGNDIFCNKLVKTITKIEKDKVYKFKDEKGTKVEKKVSSKEFKKSIERHFGKAEQVNNFCPPKNKDTKRHLSAQIMNVSSVKVVSPKSCAKCFSATEANKTQPVVPKFDIFKKVKQIYDACSCKECQCNGNDLSSCNTHSIKCKTASKFAQNLQFWEGFRAALNSLLHEKPACASVMKNQPKQNTVVVAAAGENPASSNCSCAPCDCMHCRTNVVSMSSNATHEISTGRARHQNCHCQYCLNDDCVPEPDTDQCNCNKQAIKKPAPTGDTSYDVRRSQVVYDKYLPRIMKDTVVMYVKVPKTYPFHRERTRPSFYKESECSCKTESTIELKNSSNSYCSCVTCVCEACKDAINTTEIVQLNGNRCNCEDCECDSCQGLTLDTGALCPLKLRRLEMNNDQCNCEYCRKIYDKPIPGYENVMRQDRGIYLRDSPSHTETLTTKSTKSTNCQFLDQSSSLISMFLPTTTDQENSQPSYEISSDDYLKSDDADSKDKYYKRSFYKDIFGADFHTASVTKNSKECDDINIGDCLTVPSTKDPSTATVTQRSKGENNVTQIRSSDNTTMKSIIRRMKSFTNAEKLLNIARGFSADLVQILLKYEDANRKLTENSHNYVTSILEEKKEQLFSKVNNYKFLSNGNKDKSADKVTSENEDEDVWVIDGYCSKDGNMVYIPMRTCNYDDSENHGNSSIEPTAHLTRQPTGINFFTTQDTVHLNLRFKETSQNRSKKALTRTTTKTDIIKNTELSKLPSTLQSGLLKSKTTKLDLEWKGVNNPLLYDDLFSPSKTKVNDVNSNSLKSYNNSRGDSNIKSPEKNISFYNDFKVDGIEVQRVSTCSIIIKWNSPKVDESVLGYELLIDGRPAQKILNPSRCMALVSSLPKTDKVLVTVKTILRTPAPIKYYPTMNSVYYPVKSNSLGNRQ